MEKVEKEGRERLDVEMKEAYGWNKVPWREAGTRRKERVKSKEGNEGKCKTDEREAKIGWKCRWK